MVISDNFISKSLADEIEKKLISREFPYYYYSQTTLFNQDIFEYQERVDKNTQDSPQFCHIAHREGEITSDFWPLISPILYQAINDFDLKLSIERCKVNLMLQDKSFETDGYNPPHFDTHKENYYVGIYFVNDSDGDTLFFETPNENFTTGEFKIIKRVSPKKGRFVFFKANTLHAGRPPIVSKNRCLINFIFKVD